MKNFHFMSHKVEMFQPNCVEFHRIMKDLLEQIATSVQFLVDDV